MKLIIYSGVILFSILFFSCGKKQSPEEEKYIKQVGQYRQEKDDYMKDNPSSPFNQDSVAQFEPLKYYSINTDFVFQK